MRTIVFIDQDVKVIVGAIKGKEIIVKQTCSEQAPSGSLSDGQIIAEPVFSKFLNNFFSEHRIPKNRITLVLCGSKVKTKILKCPLFSKMKILKSLPSMLEHESGNQPQVYSFAVIGQAHDSQTITASMVSCKLLARCYEVAVTIGLNVESVVAAEAAAVMIMKQQPDLDGNGGIVQVANGGKTRDLTVILEDQAEWDGYVPLLGALLLPGGSTNLLNQWKCWIKYKKRVRSTLYYLIPVLISIIVCLGITVTLLFTWLYQLDQAGEQLVFMNNEMVLYKTAEYEWLTKYNKHLDTVITIIEKTRKNLDSYPVMTSETKQVVEHCIDGLGTAMVTEYHADSGMVLIDVRLQEADQIDQFIERLIMREETFKQLHYTDLEYDQESGCWHSFVTGYLVPSEVSKEEVEL
ncbi:MAG: hypothetical protein ACRDBO_00990 [Lachnospiraceae bacterium]